MSLELIKYFKEQETIEKPTEYTFPVKETGIYFIEVTARAKSWWQKHFSNFFSDDEIKIEIDGVNFYNELGNRQRNASKFTGNSTKNFQKTIVYIVYLEKKNTDCTIRLIPNHKPTLEQINIYQVIDNKVVYVFTINNPAEDGNGRQWYSIIFSGQYLSAFSIIASCKDGRQYQTNQRDDDDLQLIIDGIKIKNTSPKSHKYWYWCGNVLKGQTKTFAQEICFKSGYHTIELNADRSPKLDRIYFSINIPETSQPPSIHKPIKDNPKWTGDFYDDSEEMILARAIWGEARSTSEQAQIAVAWSIKNRLGTKKKWDTYHHIVLEPAQYSAFWQKPPKDENLKALRDPIGTTNNPNDHRKWKETYDIAEQVIKGKIPDPTDGANHYYDDSIAPPSWAKNIKPKLEIENLNFFYVK